MEPLGCTTGHRDKKLFPLGTGDKNLTHLVYMNMHGHLSTNTRPLGLARDVPPTMCETHPDLHSKLRLSDFTVHQAYRLEFQAVVG